MPYHYWRYGYLIGSRGIVLEPDTYFKPDSALQREPPAAACQSDPSSSSQSSCLNHEQLLFFTCLLYTLIFGPIRMPAPVAQWIACKPHSLPLWYSPTGGTWLPARILVRMTVLIFTMGLIDIYKGRQAFDVCFVRSKVHYVRPVFGPVHPGGPAN